MTVPRTPARLSNAAAGGDPAKDACTGKYSCTVIAGATIAAVDGWRSQLLAQIAIPRLPEHQLPVHT